MELEKLIAAALAEDLAEAGDITSNAIFSDEEGRARLVSKDSGILAGCEVFTEVFNAVDPGTKVDFFMQDGNALYTGDIIVEVSGKVLSILTAERTAINFLSYLSGIATETRKFVEALGREPKTVILDTRKTLPGYRHLAKYAVKAGGGTNHRLGLYDMVMIKDNHIDAAGSITQAVSKVRNVYGNKYKIEVECRTLRDVEEAVGLGVDVVMLDNMDAETVKSAVQLKDRQVRFEVSGNMNLERVKQYALEGIDYISVGSLTHSVKAFDFSLQMD